MTSSQRLTGLFFALFLPFSSAHADTPDVYVEINDDEGTFDVLHERARSTATGAVLGGLIGAAIEEGIRSGKDEEKRETLLTLIQDASCSKGITSALSQKLYKKGLNMIVLPEGQETENGTLKLAIEIDSCGFKLANSEHQLLTAFVTFEASLRETGSDTPSFEERFYLTGKNQYDYAQLSADANIAQSEFSYALRRAGRRLANRILYR